MFAAPPGAWRGTGPRPTVKAALKHSEGQALALREGAAFFSPERGACPRDVERFMKHPRIIEGVHRDSGLSYVNPMSIRR